MEQEKAARVVLIRAVEEVLPEHIAPETLLEAHLAAGNPAEGPPWIVRRADFLIDHTIGAYGAVLQRVKTIHPSVWLPIGLSTVLGLASNYLGPSEKIHVLWNPIILLIAWNILIYVILVIGFSLGTKVGSSATLPKTTPLRYKHQADSKKHEYRPSLAERFVLGPVFSWLFGLKAGVEEIRDQATGIGAVGKRFATLWWQVVQPNLRLWLQRTLHLCAIGIAVGAISGMYMRGLVFKYEVIWRSTFITDSSTVEKALGYIFSPALTVLGQNLPGAVGLLIGDGVPAADWIHLYAVYALLIIVVPRSLLALTSTKRLSNNRRTVQLDFEDEYYVDLLKRATSISPKELEAATRKAVTEECSQVSEQLAGFVCVKLYDGRITPFLWRFREEGGSLRDLEKTLNNECLSFRTELDSELMGAEKVLDQRITERIKRLLGDDGEVATRPTGGFIGDVGAASSQAATHVGDRVSGNLAAIVAGTVSTSVAIVVGTLSGGFGSSLGVALLAGLVHSGPVAWVIGAVGALLATGATFALGRDKLRQSVKSIPIPATALKVAIWTNRYERLIADGRKKCEESVRESIASQMNQLSSVIADQLWGRLKPVVGELQRPQTKVEN